MKRFASLRRCGPPPIAAIAAALLLPATAGAQSDDFNDGNDAGWIHYQPLSAFGAGATYSTGGGLYRLMAPASPAPADLGPQRIGSLRAEKSYSRVRIQADITGWRDDINQSLGLIARVGSPGIGTTTGYTYNYNSVSGFHQLNLVLNEAPAAQVNESPFRLEPEHRYRMVFQLAGPLLLGQLYSATNGAVPLHSVMGQDESHAEGTAGVFAFALDAAGPLDATFDNYAADLPGLLRATMLDAAPAAGEAPAAPIESITVRVANLETSLVPESVRLQVDGVDAGFETVEERPGLFRLLHVPAAALDPAQPHRTQVRFDDGSGEQTFEWSFGAPAAPAATLLAADTLTGNFNAVPEAELDAPTQTFRVGLTGTARYFRVSDAVVRRITRVATEGARLALTFE